MSERFTALKENKWEELEQGCLQLFFSYVLFNLMHNELRTFPLLSLIARLTFPLMSFSHFCSSQTWREARLKLFNI